MLDSLSGYPQKRCRVGYGVRFKQLVRNVVELFTFVIVLSTYVVLVNPKEMVCQWDVIF